MATDAKATSFFSPGAGLVLKVAAGAVFLSALSLISIRNYLLFHGIIEVATIAIAFSIFILVWNSRRVITDAFFLIIGISFLFTGSIDLIHTLAYKGMGVFPGSTADLPTQLWIAARYFQSITFLVATFFIGRPITKDRNYDVAIIIAACTAACGLLLASIFVWQDFPSCFIEGSGLTPFKIISEYVISLILIATVVILYVRRRSFDPEVWRFLIAAQIFLVLGELAFTTYASVYGFTNMLGHLAKLLSFYFFYRAIVVVGITRPHDLLWSGIRQKEEELEQLNRNLASRVLERTRELHDANLRLREEIDHRNQVMETLRQSEEKFHNVFDWANDAILVHSLTTDKAPGRFTDVNRIACRMLGYGKEELLSMGPPDIVPSELHPQLADILRRAETEDTLLFETRLLRKDGTTFPVETSGRLVNYEGKRIWISHIRDISGRKQAEEALRMSEKIFHTVADFTYDWELWLGEGKQILYCSPACERITGYPAEDFIADPGLIMKIVHPDDRALLEEHDRNEWNSEGPGTVEFRIIHRDGSVRWIGHVCQMATDGTRHGRRVSNRDITDRRLAEEALKDFNTKLQEGIGERTAALLESELKYRILFESSRDAIMTLEPPSWNFTSGNPATIEMFRAKDEAEFISGAPWGFSPELQPDGRPSDEKAKEMIGTAMREGSNYFEWTHKRLDGEEFPATVLLTRFEWKGKMILQATVRDITELKDAEGKINASLEEKVVLLREIHHRVKNNLQIIASLLNLQARTTSDEETRQVIRDSQNRIRAMALVHERLYRSGDLARINLDEYIRFLGTSLFTFFDIRETAIRFRTDIRDIFVDINTAIPLGLIMNELISNSLKHAFPGRRGGEIFISVQRADRTLAIRYTDDGTGIPPDLDWRNTQSLGLRLVISLVEQLQGTIELDRTQGTAFTIVVQEKTS